MKSPKGMMLFVLAFAVVGVSALLITHAANGNPYPCDEAHTQLRQSTTYGGNCVKAAQWYLNHPTDGTGSYGLAEDGFFGAKTKSSVQQFQFSHHVPNSNCSSSPSTCDGIVGAATWNAFYASTAPPPPPPPPVSPPPPPPPSNPPPPPPSNPPPPSPGPICPAGYTGTPPNCIPPPPPSNPPAPSPSPSSPVPSSAPGTPATPKPSNPTLQGSGSGTSNSAVVSAQPDTEPPTIPTDFLAAVGAQGVSVNLSWQASTDNVGVAGYQLQRSTDQQSWQAIGGNITDTSYSDQSTNFNTRYFYRVRATDAAGNSSDYALASLTTSTFIGNVFPDKDTTLTNDQAQLQVVLPAGATTEAVSCSIEATDISSPNLKGYVVVAGPFRVLCKKADNSTIPGFNKPLRVQWTITSPKNVTGALNYYGNDASWYKLKVGARNGKSHTDSFTLDKGTTFVAMGKLKTTPALVRILEVLITIGLILGAVSFVLYRRNLNKKQAVYDDYYRKMNGL